MHISGQNSGTNSPRQSPPGGHLPTGDLLPASGAFSSNSGASRDRCGRDLPVSLCWLELPPASAGGSFQIGG